jgi:hypothetical protein
MKPGLFVAVLAVLFAGCISWLNGGDCSPSVVVTVDAGTDGLPPDGEISNAPACFAICGTHELCKLKDPTHVQCIPPCE